MDSTGETAIDYTYSEDNSSILLGYEIGNADLPHGRKLHIIAAGKIVRFRIDGVPGYVDFDLSRAAEEAVLLLV